MIDQQDYRLSCRFLISYVTKFNFSACAAVIWEFNNYINHVEESFS
jgi:hypothetical protein